MTNDSDRITIDIYGVCTTRDIFGLVPNNKFKVGKYFQLSYPPLFDDSDLFAINPLKPDDFIAKSGYRKRTIAADVNRTALSALQNSGSDWIIIDLRSVPKGLWVAQFGGETHYYSADKIVKKDHIIESIKAKNMEVDSLKKISYDDLPDADRYIDNFCDFLKMRYGKNIILVELKEALWLLDKEGNVSFNHDYGVEERCRQMDKQFMQFLDRLDCYYIRTPTNILYDSYNHFGDKYRVHYIQEWYDYAYKCVDLITSGDKDWIRKMDRLNIELTNLFDEIRGRNILSRTNTCKRFEKRFNKLSSTKDIEAIIAEMSQIADSAPDHIFQSEIQGRIGRIYRDRKDGYADNDTAAIWMRRASDNGLGWAKNELFDILWAINTPDSTLEMIHLAYDFSNEGDAEITGRIGRAYREGRGVAKDLDSASRWMLKSAEMGCSWAKYEYFDILWKMKTPESLRTMIEYAESESSKGDMELRARLGRAYWKGRGVPKDLRKAAELMKQTHAGNPQWSKWEYFDILWDINTPETDKELIEFILPLAETGNKQYQARLARCYRDGRGVDKDITMSTEWMRKASNQNLGWAKNELFDILWNIQTPEQYHEAFEISKQFAESGDGNAMARLAMCYRDGAGVDKNTDSAIFWMRQAANKKVSWAEKELDTMVPN